MITENTLNLDINKEEFKSWIAALRSGMYKQATGFLQDFKGYCCLGVACRVIIAEDNIRFKRWVGELTNMLHGSDPNDQANAPQWLKDINDDFGTRNGNSLIYLNDTEHLSFIEIADLLEQTYFPNGY